MKFRQQLVREIFHENVTDYNANKRSRRSSTVPDPLRLVERHFPSKIQPNEVKKTPSRRCVVCSANKSRSESRYICVPCDVGLCVDPCFEIYHTKRDFANIFAK